VLGLAMLEVPVIADIACLHCGKPFTPRRGKRYCTFECGAHNKKHGLTDTIEHRAWARIRRRCNSPTYHNYPDYGGRGIKVCERWDSFENFLADMGPKPTPKHTIERVNNDGNYEPSNCKWATQLEQNRNRRGNWTAEEDQKLRDAIARGLNFTQIAALLGKSKGSTMGHAYRNGLKSGVPPIPKKYDPPKSATPTSEIPSHHKSTQGE
jgi:hypothetical protein